MRRSDKAIQNPLDIETILRNAPVCRIAMSAEDRPYVIPVNFAATTTHLYFHSAKDGRKIDILRKNPSVCFEVDLPGKIVAGETACAWGMAYKSVIGFGRAFFIESAEEKKKALDLLMNKYAGRDAFVYADEALDKVCVIGVNIENVTGKWSG